METAPETPSSTNPFLNGAVAVNSLQDQPWPHVDYLIPELGITHGPPTLLVAPSTSGKTLLAQSIAVAVASGTALFGKYRVKQGPVLHLDYEQGKLETEIRYRRLLNGNGVEAKQLGDRLHFLSDPGMLIDDDGALTWLAKAVEGYALCVIDSLRQSTNLNENDSRASRVLAHLGEISNRSHCVFLILHHTGKAKGKSKKSGRGTSAFFAVAGFEFQLEETSANVYAVTQTKTRSIRIPPLHLRLRERGAFVPETKRSEGLAFEVAEHVEDSIKLDGGELIRRLIVASLEKADHPLTQKEILEHVRKAKGAVLEELKALEESGVVLRHEGRPASYSLALRAVAPAAAANDIDEANEPAEGQGAPEAVPAVEPPSGPGGTEPPVSEVLSDPSGDQSSAAE